MLKLLFFYLDNNTKMRRYIDTNVEIILLIILKNKKYDKFRY